ncbi:MAG: primosomal protein N' [Clostridiales bacterium]|nr:primosomal protein N' [Clostridiales bacterium]
MADHYASIIIDISHENVDRIFQYRIPGSMETEIQIGTQVTVPFGKGNRRRRGYVVEITDRVEGYDADKVKDVDGVVAGSVTADRRLIQLAWWMKERYGSTMNQALKTVLPVKKAVKARNRKVVETMVSDGWLPGLLSQKEAGSPDERGAVLLNEEQRKIADAFATDYDAGRRTPYYIYGITGSGKTEVYMEMIRHVTGTGRQVIVLIPEISLTYQTVLRFYRRFGDRICVMHSRLSAGEKYDQMERARNGKADIMIGARSALFTPFPNLGLIVMDEEQEDAYRSEGAPRYHTRDAAEKLASLSGAAFVMGSATPSLEAYTKAEGGVYQKMRLTRRAGRSKSLAATEIIDLREEMQQGNKSIFSRRLETLIRERLAQGEQTMLFINRRGYSNFVSCRSCGNAVKCPHCDVSLTLHHKTRLVCHYCGYTVPLMRSCPVCGSEYLAGFGIGTQKVEEMARGQFPDARILRMDMDTTARKGGHEAVLSAFARGEADILIGTQMIVKGHDIPGVTLVGVLAADTSLYAPDYRCGERTFQLLTQAAGRAGRGEKPGIAVIQTYMPEHYSIRTAAEQDYEEFYRQEMAYRKLMSYPPFFHMLQIQVAGKDERLMVHMMEQIGMSVKRHFAVQTEVIGPVPAPVYKVNDFYRKILYLKNENYDILVRIQKYIQQRWEETEDCRRLVIQYDFS